jgi:3-hydroxyisobutyrate dehydrogenase-like beta-hydroxyacid dehydrogenase
MKIGVIGTGRMGNLFSQNLLKAGFELTILDVNKAAYKNLTAMGAEHAESPMEVGQRAELIITSLPKNEIVQEVITGPRGILEGAKAGKIIIDMSTTFPLTTRWIGQEALKKGVDFLDAPVSGGPAGARNATLAIMVGGEKKAFERARPVLEKLGSKIFHVGKSGAGQSLKLVNNLIYNLNRLAMAEGLSLGAKAGIDPKTMVEAIAVSTGNSFALQYLAQDILQGNFEGRESSLALACKTLKLISDFSDEIGGLLLMTGLARQIYGLGKAKGWGEGSPSSIIKLYEEALGIEVRA